MKSAWQDAESCLELENLLEKYVRREMHGSHSVGGLRTFLVCIINTLLWISPACKNHSFDSRTVATWNCYGNWISSLLALICWLINSFQNNFRCIINLHINVALPRRGDQLKICSPVCVLNQQTANLYVFFLPRQFLPDSEWLFCICGTETKMQCCKPVDYFSK